MATNPMFNTKQVSNNATSPSNPLNDPDKRYFRGRNHFDYSRRFYGTFRYADIMPFECIHGVEGDILSLASSHNIRTHALSSVVQSPVHMKKTYTYTDMKCILPLNWDKIYKVPVQGSDDVPEDAYTSVSQFFYNLGHFLSLIFNTCATQARNTQGITLKSGMLTYAIRAFRLFELVVSNGSLLNYLGFHTAGLYEYAKFYFYRDTGTSLEATHTFDTLDDLLEFTWSYFYENLPHLYFASSSSDIVSPTIGNMTRSEFRSWIDKLSDDFEIYVRATSEDYTQNVQSIINVCTTLSSVCTQVNEGDENRIPVNFDSLFAYQISCVTFFSRDSIDNIYSAELYRELMKYYFQKSNYFPTAPIAQAVYPTFTYNGRKCDYDVLSAHIITKILTRGYTYELNASTPIYGPNVSLYNSMAYLYSMFSINKSLRFGDYFTGSKIAPLAVGDVNTIVNSNMVNALDMTRSLLKARFLNAVNRARNSMKSYIEDVMDGTEPPRDDEPRWLLTTTSKVKGFEVENTSNYDQGKIVTLMNSGDSNYIYEVEVGRPCIILGLCTFEVPRVYSKTIDRFFFHTNRYDMFNKFMQYAGDQQILSAERNSANNGDLESGQAFSYTPRHMEYKQRYPIAVGGYINELNSYLFVTDNQASENVDERDYPTVHISSDYIRSKNNEFDRFFPSLTGLTLSKYYHFYIAFDNVCHAYRKMEKNPTIL